MPNLAVQVIDRLFIVVYGARDPTDDEWTSYLALVESHGIERTMQLVLSDGAEPTLPQRHLLQRVLAGRAVPVAVVSRSARVRGVATMLGWLNVKMKAFKATEVEEALAYLEIPGSRVPLILEEVRRLQAIVGGGPSAMA